MNTVCTLNECTGCKACIAKCPKDAIRIKDSINAYNAVIDTSMCISCGICHRICPNNSPIQAEAPKTWTQCWTVDVEQRRQSASGGAAYAIAKAFLERGGAVVSCCFEDGNFGFSAAEKVDDIRKFSGSKYVKSDPENAYETIKKYIACNIPVLYIALPCQIAAAKNYFPSEKLLYTADLICHGTPSPVLLEKYLAQYGISLKRCKTIKFRDKMDYRCFVVKADEEAVEEAVEEAYIFDYYERAFLGALTYTENCYQCRYANLNRVADITLGDSWGSELDQEQQKQGISLVLVQSAKGEEILNGAALEKNDVDLERAVLFNHQLSNPAKKPSARNRFLRLISKGKRFNYAVARCYPKACGKQWIKKLLIKAHILRWNG